MLLFDIGLTGALIYFGLIVYCCIEMINLYTRDDIIDSQIQSKSVFHGLFLAHCIFECLNLLCLAIFGTYSVVGYSFHIIGIFFGVLTFSWVIYPYITLKYLMHNCMCRYVLCGRRFWIMGSSAFVRPRSGRSLLELISCPDLLSLLFWVSLAMCCIQSPLDLPDSGWHYSERLVS